MTKSKKTLLDNFVTEIKGDAIVARDANDGSLILGYNLTVLANTLLNGERITSDQRQAAGIALLHYNKMRIEGLVA